MKSIDIALMKYYVKLVTEAGEVYDITAAASSVSWEDMEGQLAQKATLIFASECKVGGTKLHKAMKLNRMIRIIAKWGDGKEKVFEGFIWEWQYDRAESKELTVTAYDPMIRLQQSKDYLYFSAGLSTPALLKGICDTCGVKLSYKWKQQISHPKEVFNGDEISEMILSVLEEVRQKKEEKYVVRYADKELQIIGYGTNKDVYVFNGSDVMSTSDRLSLSDIVTKVKIIGQTDDDGRTSVESIVEGNTKFGVLQEVIQRDSDRTLADAKEDAKTILSERGKPEETITVTVPDLPFLRKGDAVKMNAANLSGIFYTLGVSHRAEEKQMTLSLLRK